MQDQSITPEQALQIIETYKPIPHMFVKDVIGANTWHVQDLIVQSVFMHKLTAVKTCNAIGKGLPLDTPIATPKGWTKMGDLKAGDEVFNQYGLPTKVIAAHPTKNIECYRVNFDNGTSIVCDKDHLWTTLDWKNRHRLTEKKRKTGESLKDWRNYWDKAVTIPVTELAQSVKHNSQKSHVVPICKGLQLPKKDYELDPYVFGVWLGDGTSMRTHITDPTYEMRELIEKLGYSTVTMKDPKNYNFWPKGDGVRLLKSIGVYRNKHIPIEYLRGSYSQRLDLLRGLMDADGHATKQSGGIELCLTDERLAKDACKLIASLGFKLSVRESDAKLYGRFISRRWRITFTADISPFKLKRKTEAWHKPAVQASKTTGYFIKSVEKIDSVPTRCITVEGSIFLAGEQLIPTHNSFIAARIVITYLILHPGSIVVTTAPTWRQVTDILWREIATAVKMSRFKLTSKEVTQAGLNLDTNWYAVGLSTKRPENFFGYHADNILVVVDEAGGVEELIFKGVAAITPNINSRILYIGNPTSPGGTFYDVFTKPELGANCFTVSAFDTPNFTANNIRDTGDLLRLFTPPEGVKQVDHNRTVQETLKMPFPNLIDPATVYSRYHEWGTDSPAWEALIMGEFPSQADQALIPTNLVSMAMNMYGTDKETGKTYAELSGWEIPDGTPAVGQDMARFGSDASVMTPKHGGWVEKQISWSKADLMTSAHKIIANIDPSNHQLVLNIDDTGNGGGTTDRLRELAREAFRNDQPAHQYKINAYNFSSKEFMTDADRDKFYDITSMLYWNLRTQFYNKKIALHYDKELFDELVGRRWTIVPGGKIKVESKDDYKKRTGGKSPDKSDSLALAFAPNTTGSWKDIVTERPNTARDYQEATASTFTGGVYEQRY